MSKGHMDAAAGGAFLALNIDGAMALIENMWTIRAGGRNENNKKACIP